MKLIKKLRLGTLELDNNVIQAPLAGISCSAFRRITHEQGAPAFCCTEMLSSAKMHLKTQRLRYTHVAPEEGLLSFQIAGHRVEDIRRATAVCHEMGADLIDLNCGCPMRKIRTKGAGSKLLSSTKTLGEFIEAMRSETDRPLSIKIRVAGEFDDSCHREVAKTAESAGVDFMTVHGRHWQDDYDIAARLHQIAEVVDAVKIPVIGNGDVFDYPSMARMFTETGCAGVMVARAGIGYPWLYAKLKAEDQGETYVNPAPQVIGEIFKKHLSYLRLIESERQTVLQARRLAKHYARHFKTDPVQLAVINDLLDLNHLLEWIDQTFISSSI